MDVLILYATTEGQTRKIARFMAERIAAAGHRSELVDAVEAPADLDPRGFAAALLAGSLHAGQYQCALRHFAREHHSALNAMPTAFVSVSLSAAGHDPEDMEGLARCVDRFEQETRWYPGQVEHVAGAFRFTAYDFFKRWALRFISYRRGQPTDTSRDYELTDWDGLGGFVDQFLAKLPARTA